MNLRYLRSFSIFVVSCLILGINTTYSDTSLIPGITSQPFNVTVIAPALANFKVTATGTPTPTYQWLQEAPGAGTYSTILGATGSSYTIGTTSTANSGTLYKCVVSNTSGSVTSNPASLTVNAAVSPSITTQPINVTVIAPTLATFKVTATGSPAPTYQWLQEAPGAGTYSTIIGATGSSYTVGTTSTANSGTLYKCVVSNASGSVTSNPASLTVNAAVSPSITTQPVNVTVIAPTLATFRVTATGTPTPTYQWLQEAPGAGAYSAILGATGSSYTLGTTSTANSGTLYECVVSNASGSVASNPASLTVNAAVSPSITTQPTNVVVTAPATGTFRVTATGTPAPTYQWLQNTGGGFNAIPGATKSSYTTPSTSTADSGTKFECLVSNPSGSITSIAANISVHPSPTSPATAPKILTQPANTIVTAPGLVLFSVAVSGVPAPSYQWLQEAPGAGTYSIILGATGSSYTVGTTSTANSGTLYECVVSNASGSVTSNPASLTVNAAVSPNITTQPVNVTVIAPALATFKVTATGSPSPTYQWLQEAPGAGTYTPIFGATGSSYTIGTTSTANSGTLYECVVSNVSGSVTSSPASLTVNAAVSPSITTQPNNVTVLAPASATFKVTATGTPAPTYQWMQEAPGTVTFTVILGATSSSYTQGTTTTADSGTLYECVVSNVAGSVTSSTVSLTVNASPGITSQPVDVTVTAPATATYTVVASGTPPLLFQWSQNVNNQGLYTNIPGATNASYTIPTTAANNNGTLYECLVTNAYGYIYSTTARLTVNSPLAAPVLNSASAGNAQVILNWTPVAGATGYSVKYGTIAGNYGTLLDAGNSTSYTVTGLTNGITYYFVVEAVNAGGTSADSNELNALPDVNAVKPGIVYQNFEPDNGLPINTWPVGGASVSIVDRTDAVHSGQNALRTSSTSNWTGFGVQAGASGDLDIKQTYNDRLSFWIYARPTRLCYIYGCGPGTDNTVGLVFYDSNVYSKGFEVWTTQTAAYSQWTKLKILFSQLPSDFDLHHVTKIEFKNYMPGDYYFDDIQAQREDHIYQNFEIEERSGSTDSEYGWKWNDVDTAAISAIGEPAYEGAHSWKLVSTGNWSGTGIQSGEKRYFNNAGSIEQSFWHVDLSPEVNDRLNFWVYALPANGMDNNVSIQFYDNTLHSTDDTKVAYWPKTAVVSGQWTRVTVLFSDLLKIAPDLNLKDINKIQFQNYWPGTFYFDDIEATGPVPVLSPTLLNGNSVQWQGVEGNHNYRLQESASGNDGTWKTIYLGPETHFLLDHIAKNFLRVRWEDIPVDLNSVIYTSPWSDVVELISPSVNLNYKQLQNGQLNWTPIPQDVSYEIQSATSNFGPWATIYSGGALDGTGQTLNAALGQWYRIRAEQQDSRGVVIGLTPWSRPQLYSPGNGYVKAVDTVIKDKDGNGDILSLNGVNLGSFLVIEPWMSGLGSGDTPALPDDWTIRQTLSTRFGDTNAQSLILGYQNSYINTYDFDYLLKHHINLVRIPFYYRNLQDDNGQWILNNQGQIDFSVLDRLVDGLSDRGIYAVLDLHGAPGLQSADTNTGRGGINKLFAPDGDIYRSRTVDLWHQVAAHFKNNPWVLGYDLLNEPIGVQSDFLSLADLYDRLYQAIRSVDPKHLIIMEGVWYTDPNTNQETVDWGTLPNPQVRNWTNIMYQFHFYHWDYVDANGNLQKADENFDSHKSFIDQKIATAQTIQPQYDVPVMIGEFYGFGLKAVWDYYIQNFNTQHWSWTSWSYKYHDSPSNWGLMNHVNYNESLPSFQNDTYADLQRKLSEYGTSDFHAPNVTLQNMIEKSSKSLEPYPLVVPYITQVSMLFLAPGQDFTITGRNFGTPTSNSTVQYNGSIIPVISWGDTSIHVYLTGNQATGSGPLTVTTDNGTSNGVDIIVALPDADAQSPSYNSTNTSLPETFLDTFERCDGRPLGTHGCV